MRPAIMPTGGEPGAAAYIAKYKDLAISEMRRTGVPASITLAQGMIESNFGRSSLALEGNNHFGIKCHDDWTGKVIRHNDDRRNECFRKYPRPEDSFYDHSDFLRTRSRYTFLFDLSSTDYRGWARGLKKAGYATNPDYANMLISKIEENSLHAYDLGFTAVKVPDNNQEISFEEKLADAEDSVTISQSGIYNKLVIPAPINRAGENNRIQYVIVQEGETREMIEREFDLLRWELQRYNDLDEEFVPVPGQLLYLQPKRDRAEAGKETHTVAEGDSMYSISQKYGIKLQKLYELNRMTMGEEPDLADRLWLRTIRPVM